MHDFIERNAQNLQYEMSSDFCEFNQRDREAIRTGFKNRMQEAMTEREHCELLETDCDEIVERRRADGPANVKYILEELIKTRSRQVERIAGRMNGRHREQCT